MKEEDHDKNVTYTSDEFLELEGERLLPRTWPLAGFAREIPNPGDAAHAPKFTDVRRAVVDMWKELNGEDIQVLERMQQGRRSPGFDGGTLSLYWDGAVRHFARLMVEALDD